MSSPIFFDHQAGTPLPAAVRAAMEPFLNDSANPASLHRGGVRARQALAEARGRVARLIGAAMEEIVFTSGGTESVNLALFGHARANRRRGTHLVVAATEHAAVLRSVEKLAEEGFTFSTVPVDGAGRITLEAVAAAVRPETSLVAVHWANHEVGTIAPVAELAAWCREREITFFSDASAAAGTVPIDLAAVAAGVSLLALSPHRFGGPKGAGVLYVRRGTALEPILFGGGQEEGRRAGTENLAAIVGAGLAAELLGAEREERVERIGRVQRLLWRRIGERVEGVSLHGAEPGPERTVDNLNFSAAGIEGEAQALLCDLRGLLVSSGAACVSRDLRISHVLRAMGVSPDLALSNLVATLGPENTEEEAERAAGIYAKVVEKLRAVAPRRT